jgi:APA family basic amino acid/polyamine antiporter
MSKPVLSRSFGLWTAVSIVAGSIIGSGIFVRPAMMAAQLGSPEIILIVWIVAGIISMFGGMINAEIGAMFPQTGGQYIYLKNIYGDFFSFLYGWSAFAVINTAAVASIGFVFSQYMEYFFHLPRFDAVTEQSFIIHLPFIGNIFPLENFGIKSLTILLIIGLTLLNYFSTHWGGMFQYFFSALKIAAILILVFGIFIFGDGSFSNFTSDSLLLKPTGLAMIGAFAAATTGAFNAYDGWNNITFMAGELKNPQRNLPLSLFIGIFICIVCYVLVNQACLYVLPVDEMAASTLVASDAMKKVFGITGGGIIAAMVVISTFGCSGANIMATSRVTFAMAREKKFFSWAGIEHPRFFTPGNALLLHMIWTCLFIISGSFEILADMFVFITWIFYGAIAAGVFILRKRLPQAERPYKVWGYPLVPLIFFGFTIYYIAATLYNDITNYLNGNAPLIKSILGLALTAAGIPLYFYFRKKNRRMLN